MRLALALLLAPLAALAQDAPDGSLDSPPPVRRALTLTSADTLTTEAFDALPDQATFSGVVADRWPNGRLRLLRSVVRGRPAGLWTEWYETGVVRYLAEWDPERSGEGVWYYFHETGLVRDRSVYHGDRAFGPSEGWHANGLKAYEGRYRANERVGRWRWWNEGGGLDSLRTYPDGGPVWEPFEPGVVSLPGVRETSPSISADGQTLLFARTTDCEDKVPYLATLEGDGWRVERAAFADTVYNAALAPDGRTVFFQTHERVPRASGGSDGDSLVFRAFRSKRTVSGWAEPGELSTLAGLDAGYFSVAPDGSLTLFAWQPRGGLYRAEPDGAGGYGDPVWLGDALAPNGATSFDALVHPDGDRLVVTRDVPEARRGALGESGFYLYRLVDGAWTEDRRLPLPYGWGATVLPDERFLFVLDGDLQTVPLTALGLDW